MPDVPKPLQYGHSNSGSLLTAAQSHHPSRADGVADQLHRYPSLGFQQVDLLTPNRQLKNTPHLACLLLFHHLPNRRT